jgi:hypothetical protein
MYKLYLFLILTIVFCNSVKAETKSLGSEQINLQLSVRYDEQVKPETLTFSGSLGSVIEGVSDTTDPFCKIKMLFRKIKLNSENQIESWTSMECTKQQQKPIVSKLKKLNLKIQLEPQKIKLKYPNKQVKNMEFVFAELSLKKAKK